MAQVRLEDVVKRYGDVLAVNNVSLTVDDGEFVALVGPSGCGKTTTLNLVAGLIEITDGEIFIGDRLVNDLDPKDRDIAMVFQNYALYPNKTIYKNLAFPLRMRKLPKAEIDAKVKAAAKLLDIEHLLERRPRELSGGQQQRVALGRALVRDPAVFLMDEPLSNLDAKLRVQMRAELKRFHQDLNATVVYVTHDQLEAVTMADKMAVMSGGVLQQYDTPERVFSEPVNTFVAGFVGSPAMNLIDVRVGRERRRRHARERRRLALRAVAGQCQEGARPPPRPRSCSAPATAASSCTARPGQGAIPARVYTLEPTGDITYAHRRSRQPGRDRERRRRRCASSPTSRCGSSSTRSGCISSMPGPVRRCGRASIAVYLAPGRISSVKITRLGTAVIEGNFPWVLVRVETDAGISGLGEAYWGAGVAELVHKAKPLLIGQDPRQHRQARRGDDPLPVGRGLAGRRHRHRDQRHRDRALGPPGPGPQDADLDLLRRPVPRQDPHLCRLPRRRHARSRRLCEEGQGGGGRGLHRHQVRPRHAQSLHDRHLRRPASAAALVRALQPHDRLARDALDGRRGPRRPRGGRARDHGGDGRALEVRRQRRDQARPGARALRPALARGPGAAREHRGAAPCHAQHADADLHRREPLPQARLSRADREAGGAHHRPRHPQDGRPRRGQEGRRPRRPLLHPDRPAQRGEPDRHGRRRPGLRRHEQLPRHRVPRPRRALVGRPGGGRPADRGRLHPSRRPPGPRPDAERGRGASASASPAPASSATGPTAEPSGPGRMASAIRTGA